MAAPISAVSGCNNMSIATLLVYVDLDGDLNGRVRLASGLAGRFQSHLVGLGAWMPRPPFVVEGVVVDPEPTENEIRDMKAALAKRGEQFKAAAGAGRSVEWRSALEFPTEFVARQSRSADLIVIGRDRTPYDPYRFTDAGALVLRAGRPVLMVPPGVQSLAAKRVVIGWKDAREARRALQDALPFLRLASEVILLEACEAGSEQDAQHGLKDIAGYLARHQIKVVAERVRPIDGTASNTLLRLVEEQSADLIVVGAYGHSRLGEWAFGGMTQDLLAKSPVCCLFSH
jgi:nucleotide-binding universal stress UspA family protein